MQGTATPPDVPAPVADADEVKKRRDRKPYPLNFHAPVVLRMLMNERGWFPIDIERASARTGHPMRTVNHRTVYRLLETNRSPGPAVQFEIAATFPTADGKHLLPSHIWGSVPLPEPYAHLNESLALVA